MRRIVAFGRFWWDFVVGDDWRAAAGLALALAACYGVHRAGVAAWWVLPPATVLVLAASLHRAVQPPRTTIPRVESERQP